MAGVYLKEEIMTPFKERMNLYRAYRELNPDKNYWDWKASLEVPAMSTGGRNEEYVAQADAIPSNDKYRQDAERELNLEEAVWLANHTDNNTGVVSPYYNSVEDTYSGGEGYEEGVPLNKLMGELVIRPEYKSAAEYERTMNRLGGAKGREYFHNAMHELDAGRKVFNAAQWIPIVGAVGGVTEIGLDLARGNWQGAAINAALELLPESVERGIKARRIATAIDNSALNYNLRMPHTEHRISVDAVDEPTVRNFVDMQMWLDSASKREMREFLKTRFNKWTKRYGYEPVPLDLSVNDAKEEMKKRILQHNTFVRGVRDPMVEIDYPGVRISPERAAQNVEILDALAKRHGFPEGTLGRLLAAASTYAGRTGHGRQGVSDSKHGALYSSNSLDTASDYASINGDPVGEVFSIQRPVDFSGDYREWLLHGDFPLRKSETGTPMQDKYVIEDLPYLLNTGRSLNQDVLKKVPITFEDYAERFNVNVTGTYSSVDAVTDYYNRLLQQVDEWFDSTNPGKTRFYKRSLGGLQNKLLNEEQLRRLRALRVLHDLLKYGIRGGVAPLKTDLARLYFSELRSPYNNIRLLIQKAKKRSSYHNYDRSDYLAREARSELLKAAGVDVNDMIAYWNKQPIVFTTEHRRKPTRKSDDAYNHYIILGEKGDIAVDNVNMLDTADWWGLGSRTRAHVGKSSQGFSRKFTYGGTIPAMQNGGETQPGGYTEDYWSLAARKAKHKDLDPTSRFGPEALLIDNAATGEEDLYWRAYLGLDNWVPAMNENAKTEWDDEKEAERIAEGKLPSEFFGTTLKMDLNLQAVADTLHLGEIYRNYDEYSKNNPDVPTKRSIKKAYDYAKKVMDHPGKWLQMDANQYTLFPNKSMENNEYDPLGMLGEYGMKWVPEDKALYVHDTYDFPWYAKLAGSIKDRPREMKIRGKINFNPEKGAKLFRNK